MRRAARTDGNHSAIVAALRSAGCGVLDLSAVGDGCPDLLVHVPLYPWSHVLLEIKDGSKPPSRRMLTPEQIKFHAAWKGFIYVVKSVEEALNAVGVSRHTGGPQE